MVQLLPQRVNLSIFSYESMKYIFISGSMNAGGAEKQLFNLISSFPSSNLTLFCFSLSPQYRRALSENSIDFYELSLVNLFSFLNLFRFVFNLHSPVVIQGWLAKGNFVVLLLKYIFPAKFPIIFLGHRSLININQSFFSSLLIRLVIILSHCYPRSITHICNSKIALLDYNKACSQQSNYLFIPNGYDLSRSSPPKPILKKVYFPLKFLVVSRFSPEKGLDNIISALKGCSHLDLIHVTFIGHGVDNLRQLLLHSPFAWSLYDSVDNLSDFYLSSHFLIHFPLSESSSNVISESLLHSLPVISNCTGDTPSIVGDAGFISPSFSVTDYTSIINDAFNVFNDPVLYHEMRNKAYLRSARLCSYAEMSHSYYFAFSSTSIQ